MANYNKQRELESCADQIVINREMVNIFRIFPEEIWLKIIGYITDPTDLEALSNASLYYRQLLYSDRIFFLFSKFYNIFGRNYRVTRRRMPGPQLEIFNGKLVSPDGLTELVHHNLRSFGNELLFEDEEPEHLWIFVQKKFRLVCHSWCHFLDDFYQKRNRNIMKSNNLWQDREVCYEFKPKFWIYFFEHHLGVIDIFMREFEETHGNGNLGRNPFVGRSVTFKSVNTIISRNHGCNQLAFFTRFCIGITNLLEKYGHHIWYCAIAVKDRFETRVEYYDKLKQWLELMPNLKMLELEYDLPANVYDERDLFERTLIPDATQIATLDIRVRDYPAVKMENLERLRMRNVPSPIFNELATKNDHAFCEQSSTRMFGPYNMLM